MAAMFSGRWEKCLDHDSQGRIFLDFDPYCFENILMFLRCHLSDSVKNVTTPSPVISTGKEHAFKSLVDYLGLAELFDNANSKPLACKRQANSGLHGRLLEKRFKMQFRHEFMTPSQMLDEA